MNSGELRTLLKSKEYPESLIEWAIKFYPLMCNYFGIENTINFFNEYQLIPRDKIGNNSGATNKDKKIIIFDWQMKNFHEALTLFIHEAAHAIGSLEISEDNMLMEGHKYRESFLGKLEEGLVSDKQNSLEYGELNYTYMTINTFDENDEFHKNNFKTQPSHKYTINNVYYRILQLLLGVNSNLLTQNMFAKTKEEKNYCYNQAVLFLKDQLSEEEFLLLLDCACIFTLNYSYHGDTVTILNYLNDDNVFKNQQYKIECINRLKEEFPKNFSYAEKRNLLGKNIFTSIDNLCFLILNVLIRRLKDSKYDSFSAIKEACTYLVKIDNNSEKLQEKRNKLKSILTKKMNELFPQLINIDLESSNMTENDKFILLTQIISLANFTNKNLNNIYFYFSDDLLHISIAGCGNYIVKKENIYSDEEISFIEPIPIGYEIKLMDSDTINLENIQETPKSLK